MPPKRLACTPAPSSRHCVCTGRTHARTFTQARTRAHTRSHVHVYAHAHAHAHTDMNTNANSTNTKHVHAHACVRSRTHTHACTCARVHMDLRMRACARPSGRLHAHARLAWLARNAWNVPCSAACTHARTRARTHTHTHMRARTHTQTPNRAGSNMGHQQAKVRSSALEAIAETVPCGPGVLLPSGLATHSWQSRTHACLHKVHPSRMCCRCL